MARRKRTISLRQELDLEIEREANIFNLSVSRYIENCLLKRSHIPLGERGAD